MAVASLANRIQVNTNCANNDALYGPYNSIAEAISSIPSALLNGEGARGRTIGVLEDGKVVEYWWQPEGDGYAFVKKGGREQIIVDNTLNNESSNPIANKAVANQFYTLEQDLKGDIEAKANKSEVDSIYTRVGTLETTITSKAEQSEVETLQTVVGSKAESSEVSALSGRVDSVEGNLEGKVGNKDFHDYVEQIQSAILGKADKVVLNNVSGDQEISPNTMYVWGSVAGALTITKGGEIAGIVNNYMVRFIAGEGCAVTFSGFELDWFGGEEPTWTAGNTYEISIVDNIALWAEIG